MKFNWAKMEMTLSNFVGDSYSKYLAFRQRMIANLPYFYSFLRVRCLFQSLYYVPEVLSNEEIGK